MESNQLKSNSEIEDKKTSIKNIEESNFPKHTKSQKMINRKGTLKANTKFSFYKTNPHAKSHIQIPAAKEETKVTDVEV